MTTQVEGIGKNVEQAIEDAILQLKTSRDNVDIKIIETGGIFKKAKVLVSISEDYLEKYKKTQKFKKEEAKKESKQQEKETKKEVKTQVKKQKVEKEIKKEQPKQEKQEVKKQEVKEQPKQEKNENEALKGKQFLENFVKTAGIEAVVDMFEDENEIFYTIMGEEASRLIGYRGECLNSLQFLTTVINGKHNRRSKRVRLDIDGYREKRKNTLEMLARRVSKKVLKTGHQTRLEPMTAYERRIIHTTVQEFEGISSVSRGEEPHRYLIIKKQEEKEVKAASGE